MWAPTKRFIASGSPLAAPAYARLLEVLSEVHLGELAERTGGLDAVRKREKVLSMGEQQCLAFARVLARQPRIVILDEATRALDSANDAALYAQLPTAGTTPISIVHRAAVLRHHTHVLELQGVGAWQMHAAQDFRTDHL